MPDEPTSEVLKRASVALKEAEDYRESIKSALFDTHAVLQANGLTAGASPDKFADAIMDDPKKLASVVGSLIGYLRTDDTQKGRAIPSQVKSAGKVTINGGRTWGL